MNGCWLAFPAGCSAYLSTETEPVTHSERKALMPIMEISIVPIGTNAASVGGFVAKAIEVLRKERGIKYRLTPMGTIVEAESFRKLLAVAAVMHEAVFECGVKRLVTVMKIDDRRDKISNMEGKIKSVRLKLRKSTFKGG